MKKQKENFQYGFTLAEILLVLAIIMILAVMSLTTLVNSQQTQVFNNQFEKVFSMINNARSYAISGRGQLDYVDSDNDNVCKDVACSDKVTDDYVAPVSYGVVFKPDGDDGDPPSIMLFANMHAPEDQKTREKQFDRVSNDTDLATGHDLVLETFVLNSQYELELDPSVDSGENNGVIFYSPLYVDISFSNLKIGPAAGEEKFLVVRLKESEGAQRCRQIKIHYLTGIPEVEQCP